MSIKLLFYIYFLLLAVLSTCSFSTSYAQKSDSTNFDLQKERVNKLIETRSSRFGDFDKSIQQKTGIFGIFKTKKDMQTSIEILKSIVIADNNILLETKKLIDIKDNENLYLSQKNDQFEQQISAYISTIGKLQEENQKLKMQLENQESISSQNTLMIYIISILSILLILPNFLKACRRSKSHK